MLQRQVAELWMGLALRQGCGPGTLSVCQHDGDRSFAFLLSCIGCGGAALLLADDSGQARMAARMGAVDFVVDTLGEALRILKNELRQRRSVSVALVGSVEGNTVAMEERGVQPQFVDAGLYGGAPWAVLVHRGAVPIVCDEVRQEGLRGAASEKLLLDMHVAAGLAERRAEDETLREILSLEQGSGSGPARAAAQQWTRVAPRLFSRDLERVFWRTLHEESER